MINAFNVKAANAVDTVILERYFNPHADAYLVLGRLSGSFGYFFAWESRHKKGFVDGVSFKGEKEARKYFDSMVEDPRYSDHPWIEKDWQVEAVYAWEAEYLDAFSKFLSEAEVTDLMRRIARDYRISLEDLVWGEEETDAQNGVESISFLHEMAHHVHDRNEGGDVPVLHAPGFVRCAMELYHRYAGIDPGFLAQSAAAKNILGDPDEIPHIIADIRTKSRGGDSVREFRRKKPEQGPQQQASFG